jgi:hypothetical protein
MDTIRRLRWALWCALAGAGLGILGIFVDQAWHAGQDGSLVGWEEVLQAHWLTLIAVAVTFTSMAVATRSVAGLPRPATLIVWIGFAGTCADLVGQIWDNAMHAGGQEAGLAHTLSTVGAPVMLVCVLVALVLTRRSRIRPAGEVTRSEEPAADRAVST